MADKYKPFVYWGQDKQKIYLKIELSDVSKPDIKLDEDWLHFEAEGLGVRGVHKYYADIEFYLPIVEEKSRSRVGSRFVEFQIQKYGEGEIWPRLMVEPKKPAWLKIDFDHFAFDDSSEEEETYSKEEEEKWMREVKTQMKEAEDSAFTDLRKFYLFVYNMFQWVGFSYVFISIMLRYFRDGEVSKHGVYEAVGGQLMICQFVAMLEVLHPILGFVKANVAVAAMQQFGRNLALFGLIAQSVTIQQHNVVWWLFVTWSAVELVRYPFYMLNCINKEIGFITWLRYTVWIPLYPMGFICEGFLMMLALPEYTASGRWSLALPNRLNWSFHFPTFLQIYMLAFLPGMYLLMRRMYEQRKQKIKPFIKKKMKTS